MRALLAVLPLVLTVATSPAAACVTDADCADATVCNGSETCVGGVCQPGTPLNCNDGSPCTTDSCDPVTGCRNTPLANGISCSDGNVCNGAEICQDGVCTPGTPPHCIDANPCTTDACDPVAGHCVYTPVLNGTLCTDANVCNGIEICQGGMCTPGMALDCDDGNDCTVDGCDPLAGCTHTVATDGTVCGDGNPCNGTETCLVGVCLPGMPIPPGGSCSDGDVCNGEETCQGGVCAAGTPLDCNDGNVCTDDVCHPQLGCVHDATVCDDANPTTNDICVPPATGCQFHALVPGNFILLRASATNPSRMKMRLVSGGMGPLASPPRNGGPSDPVGQGASLRVITNVFDRTYVLPPGHWAYIGRVGTSAGYRYRDKLHEVGPIISVVMRDGGLNVASGKGQELQFAIPSDPDPVRVVLQLGLTKYCMSFGGQKRFVPEAQFYKAKAAPAPGACPP